MHISSLWGDNSIGSFGKSAKEFIDFLEECKFSYWQVLPFSVADDCNSPYQSYSAFGGNPYFIDLDILLKKGLITKDELDASRQKTPYLCEYERLYEERLALLKKASQRAANKEETEKFIGENRHLLNFCEFMGRKAKNENLPWYEWENDDCDEEIFNMWKFIQFEFFSQWQEIKEYANEKGIKIIGDIPIYVALDSSDVWSNPDCFMLKDNLPSCVAGVPPDYFCENGQLWGNPLYNWENMKKDGYKWWQERLMFMLKIFDGVRIDHFRAFESYWAVPFGEVTARNGEWKKGPGMDLIKVFQKIAGDKLIIAEDLGDIDDNVRELVKKSGFWGMNVFQFGFFGDTKSNHVPHNYKKNSVSYTGTHDNNTLLGYLWELSDEDRKRMLSYCGFEGDDWERGYNNILKTVFMSHSDLVILPIQDLLGYGSDTRLNTPGVSEGNWSFRITKEQLLSIDKEKFKSYNKIYGRD